MRQYNCRTASVNPWADLTILLALKGRVEYTRRWLAYAVSERLRCRILVADGGDGDDTVRALVADARAQGIDVEYRRYPPDVDYQAYYAKLADALTRVTTRFVVLADNDDFFVTGGLREALEFLLSNPGYVACGGQCAVFWVSGGAPGDFTYGTRVEWKTSSRLMTDVAETAEQRLRDRALHAHEVFYAVQRTDLLARHFAAVRDTNPRDLFLMPHLLIFLSAIAGKTHQLDTLYIARQQDSPGSSGGAHERKHGDWVERMLEPTWSDDFSRFLDHAATALAEADGIPLPRARRVVKESYVAAVAPSLLSDVLEEPTITLGMPLVLQVVRRLVAKPRNSVLRRAAQAIYRRTPWLSHDLVLGVEVRTRRARDAAREFAPIGKFLRTPRQSS